MSPEFPKLIFVTGVDGAGKTSLANWLVDQLNEKQIRTGLVWSRFHNYLSKPLLALTRVTGHNYYKNIDGVSFGFHDFDRLHGLRYLFVLLQAIDVNLATFRFIGNAKKRYDTVVCERGPWDTLVDVISDTDLDLTDSFLSRIFIMQVRNNSKVLFVNRSKENILHTRPELVHDIKLEKRIEIYEKLEKRYGWFSVNNNETLEKAKNQVSQILKI